MQSRVSEVAKVQERRASSSAPAPVFIREATYDSGRLDGVVSELLDVSGLDVQGRSVLVKPNILGPFEVERAVTTHPAVVRAVVANLKRRGARVMVGDNPGMRGYGENILSAKRCGIYDACPEEFVNMSERPLFVETYSRFTRQLLVSRQALEADLFLTLPKFKTHLVTTITGAVKNSFGLLVGGQKSEMHRLARSNRDFCEAVVDVYQIRPPDLAIMDAVVGMQGMGPSSDDLREVGKLLACRNAVTLDAGMAMMMGADPQAVAVLRIAHERGLGEIRRGQVVVDGRLETIKDFKLPSGHMRSVVGTALARLFTYIMVKRPVVERSLCAKCGMCAKQCPVEAITMSPYPVINVEKCFSCFCCHEFCKHNAVRVTRSVRFLRRVIDH
jgi:uncharacterized protein (DUF362 family)/Pyruvate/2-oxoacid:ferredoxin oxidoreductase delta subunit